MASAQVTFSVRRIYATPAALPRDASEDRFSESRALDTVKDLTETIGFRIVRFPQPPCNFFRSADSTRVSKALANELYVISICSCFLLQLPRKVARAPCTNTVLHSSTVLPKLPFRCRCQQQASMRRISTCFSRHATLLTKPTRGAASRPRCYQLPLKSPALPA